MRCTALAILVAVSGCTTIFPPQRAPEPLHGRHVDDYRNSYLITHDEWVHVGYATYHIELWNEEEQYLVARNDEHNPTDGGRWTRIDWMELEGIPYYEWAFCLTAYNAASAEEAVQTDSADRENPRSGCNGFPFSRMSRVIRGKCSPGTPDNVLC